MRQPALRDCAALHTWCGIPQPTRFSFFAATLDTLQVPQSRWVYQHNRRIRLRAQVFYTMIERNTDLYSSEVEEESEELFTQILFSYKLNPQTIAYLGYSDNSQAVLDDQQQYDLTRKDRTFFVKFGYAWTR